MGKVVISLIIKNELSQNVCTRYICEVIVRLFVKWLAEVVHRVAGRDYLPSVWHRLLVKWLAQIVRGVASTDYSWGGWHRLFVE